MVEEEGEDGGFTVKYRGCRAYQSARGQAWVGQPRETNLPLFAKCFVAPLFEGVFDNVRAAASQYSLHIQVSNSLALPRFSWSIEPRLRSS
jgi:hypothetical protein